MTPEQALLIASILPTWILAFAAVVGVLIERRDRKAQVEEWKRIIKSYEETVDGFKASVESYEETLKKAPRKKVDPAMKAEVERQKTLREQARLEKEKVKQTTELIKAGRQLFGKK